MKFSVNPGHSSIAAGCSLLMVSGGGSLVWGLALGGRVVGLMCHISLNAEMISGS